MAVLRLVAFVCLLQVLYCHAEGDLNLQPVENEFQPWTFWSACSVTCESGSRIRSRYVKVDTTVSYETEQELCETDCPKEGDLNLQPVEDEFQPWTFWSACSVTCGSGSRIRSRYTNADTTGSSETEQELCETDCPTEGDLNVQPVEDEFQPWTFWSACSVTCESGSRIRSRYVKVDTTGSYETEQELCETDCPTDIRPECEMSVWKSWNACSQTKGKGIRTRTREYVDPECPSDETFVEEEICGTDCAQVIASPGCVEKMTEATFVIHEPVEYRCSTSTLKPNAVDLHVTDMKKHMAMADNLSINN